jgi:hypothetical protein
VLESSFGKEKMELLKYKQPVPLHCQGRVRHVAGDKAHRLDLPATHVDGVRPGKKNITCQLWEKEARSWR